MNDSQRRLQASRASDTASRPNGSQKKSSATAPSCRSFVHSEAEPAPGDEQRERPGERPELPRAVVAADQLPAEQHRRAGDHGVERDEQVRVGRADVHRDPRRRAGERRDGDQPRPAAEERARSRPRRARRRRRPPRRPSCARRGRGRRRGTRSRASQATSPASRRSRRGATITSASPAAATGPPAWARSAVTAGSRSRVAASAWPGTVTTSAVAPRLRAARGARAARAPPSPCRAPSRQRTRRSAETPHAEPSAGLRLDRGSRELDVADDDVRRPCRWRRCRRGPAAAEPDAVVAGRHGLPVDLAVPVQARALGAGGA